jgi:hypothetical protein
MAAPDVCTPPATSRTKDFDEPADTLVCTLLLEHKRHPTMQINGISTVAPIVASKSGPPTTSSAKPTSASTPATSTPATAGAPTSASVSSTVRESTTSAPSTASSTSAATPASAQTSAPTQSEASAVSTAASLLESSTYSTSVDGKSYAANISQANGTYTLSVPNLPGASVSGSSLSLAESALSIKIDTLV